MKIAIVDDQINVRDSLKSIVQTWTTMNHQHNEVFEFQSADALLFWYEENKDLDIVLLDIEMPGVNGIECAKRIRTTNTRVQIIFVSGYIDYLEQGYDVEALHYLVKPIQADKLLQILSKAQQRLLIQEKTLWIQTKESSCHVFLSRIKYIEAQKNYVDIHADERLVVRRTLSEIESELDENFIRLGRSLILNIRFIQKIFKDEVWLSEGVKIPIPKNGYEILNRALIERF